MIPRSAQKTVLWVGLTMAACLAVAYGVQQQPHTQGYTDTPIIPGQKWHVHDKARPYPAAVTPGDHLGDAPSDAEVLFDGKSLDNFSQSEDGSVPAKWKLVDGTIEVVGGTGNLYTKAKYGDCQLHIEWREDPGVTGESQGRGNSGVFLQSTYEIQVLDSYKHATYADGQAGGIYGQWPPLVNPMRPPGEWQTYDIVFKAPKWNGDKLAEPAYITLFFNGVLAHDHQKLNGPTNHAVVTPYEKQAPELPIALQDHGPSHPLRYRNIWVRRLKDYDQPEKP